MHHASKGANPQRANHAVKVRCVCTPACACGAIAVVLYRAVRSRRRRAITSLCLLAALALTRPAAAQSLDGRFVEQTERFEPDNGTPIELRFAIARTISRQTARIVDTTRASLSMLSGWFGPFPASPLVIVAADGVPPEPGSALPGRTIVANLHWVAPVRDQHTEREIIRGLVRAYWSDSVATPPDAFQSAVIAFVTMRAIHQRLEGSNFAAPRFFGGLLPFPLRSLLLSPPVADPRPRVWWFGDAAERTADAGEARRIRGLQTIQRYVGWPAMLEALSAMRAGGAQRTSAAGLAETLSAIRGTDMRWLIDECLRDDATFDYRVEHLTSRPAANGLIESTITIARSGNGRFALADQDDNEAALPVLIKFADGTQFRDVFDGAAPSAALVYTAPAPAVGAFVDPDAMLLLDTNRSNNAIVRDAPTSKLGVRLALHWLSWLQNAMMSYTALL